MIADLACHGGNWFDFACRAIAPHDPTHLAGPLVEALMGAVAMFATIYVAGRIVRRAVVGTMRKASSDRQVRALTRNLITVATFVVALLSAMVVAGVDVALLVTAAGIGTVAIGLAFQDVLRNVLAGIFLLLEHPFRLGDSITVAEQAGVVQNITLRTTTLRTGEGTLAVIPNLTVFTHSIVNSSHFGVRRFTVSVRLPAGADLAAALRGARETLAGVDEVAPQPPPSLHPKLDGEAVIVSCNFWVDQREHDVDAVVAAAAERLWDIARA